MAMTDIKVAKQLINKSHMLAEKRKLGRNAFNYKAENVEQTANWNKI